MGKPQTLDSVTILSRQKHGDKYTYLELYKVKNVLHVKCECPIHGEFSLRAARHYTEGKGCPKCATTTSKDEFLIRAEKMHGTKYDYSLVSFNTLKDKVTIICDIHGEFRQTAGDHLLYYGCPSCGIKERALKNTSTTDAFINKAIAIHGDKYSYLNVQYVSATDKVNITCKVHGDFAQIPASHLSGQGCNKCGRAVTTNAKRSNPDANGWSYSNWEIAGNKSKLYEGFRLYVVECWNADEKFVKVGKTYTSIANRFRGKNMPYEWRLCKEVLGSARFISELEARLHKNLKDKGHSYTPQKKFDGMYECYSINVKDIEI